MMTYIKDNDLCCYDDFVNAWPGAAIPKTFEQLVAAGYGPRRLPHVRPYLFKKTDIISYFSRLGFPAETVDALARGLGLKSNVDPTLKIKNAQKVGRKPAKQ